MAENNPKISKVYTDLDLDFTANQRTGVAKKNDLNAVKQAMKILILTNFYERPFYPKKGGNIRGLLFDNMTPLLANTIQQTIINLVNSYEPRAILESVTVTPNYDNNAYEISIEFYAVNINKPDRLSVELVRLR